MMLSRDQKASDDEDFASSDHQSLSVWLLLATTGCLFVLGAAILGSSYTGFQGDWLSGSAQFGGQIYLAEVGLTDVRLRLSSGAVRTLSLRDACAQTGGGDSASTHWCDLDSLGADTEAMLTAAFVPALVVGVLSLMTTLQNCCSASDLHERLALEDRVQRLGITSALYNATMLLAWLIFWLMTVSGLCIYAFRRPASLGVGPAITSKSYGLLRACVLFTSLGALALVARVIKLWDTRTVQHQLQDIKQSRLLKLALYCMLGAQLVLYIPVTLVSLDYSAIVPLLGVNYLGTKQPQMMWAYVLLTIATLPQDAALLAGMSHWASMDSIERTARTSFALIVAMKLVLMVGMAIMHTRVRLKLQFFEFEDAETYEESSFENDAASRHSSPTKGSPGGYSDGGSPAGYSSTAASPSIGKPSSRRPLDP